MSSNLRAPCWRHPGRRHDGRAPGRGAGAIPAATRAGPGAGPLAGRRQTAAVGEGRQPPPHGPPRTARRRRPGRARQRRPTAAPTPPRRKSPRPAAATAVACSGVFAKDSTHLKLAIKYDSRNITFGRGRRTGGQQDSRLDPVSERSQAPPRGDVGQRRRPQRHIGDRDQRQVAMERAEGNEARPAARRAGKGERPAVQAFRLRRRRHRGRGRMGGRRAEHAARRLQDGHAAHRRCQGAAGRAQTPSPATRNFSPTTPACAR